MADDIVRHRSQLSIAVGSTETGHVAGPVTRAQVSARQQDLNQVDAFGIVDRVAAREGCVIRLSASSVPFMATGADALEDAAPELIFSILQTRFPRGRGGHRGGSRIDLAARLTSLRLDMAEITGQGHRIFER